MVVRPLQWSDFQGWTDVYFSRYDELPSNPELGVLTHPTRPSLAEESAWYGRFFQGILKGDAVAFVCEEGGKVLGIAEVTRKGPHVEDAHVGLLGIALVQPARGRGVGDQLMAATLEACRGKFEMVQLGVFAVNERAIRLYRKHGFQEYGRAPRAIKRGGRYLDEVLMWRPIDPARNG